MKIRKKRILFLFNILLVSASVFSSQEFKNKDKPLKGEWDFHLEKEWSVASAGEELFANPRQIRIADEGKKRCQANFLIYQTYLPHLLLKMSKCNAISQIS